MSEEQNSSCIHLALFQALSQQRCGGGRDGTAEISKLWGVLPCGSSGFHERVLDLGLGFPVMFLGALIRHRSAPFAALIKHFPYDGVGPGWLPFWLWACHSLAV